MAVSDVSPAHQNPVCAALKGTENEMGGYRCRAHDSNGMNVRGILHSVYPGKVSCSIGAPVAEKCDNFRFKSILFHLSLLFYIKVYALNLL
jgi:hypothetical protein